ncbi:hypothetical protein HN843_08745 [bacterium]|nr:hypothetical protein [bacterium]
MNEIMNSIGQRMPSVDWIAFGLAVICSALTPFVYHLGLIVPVAVFLPSILRELGLLNDGDEFTRRVMHRAGFHTLLVVALLVFAIWSFKWLSHDMLTGETLRKIIMYPFVVSYILQYWGARDGAFRILLGIALWATLPIFPYLTSLYEVPGGQTGVVFGSLLGSSVVIIALAYLVRRWPRAGGVLLLAMFVASIAGSLRVTEATMARVAVPSMILQACIFPGTLGLALLLSGRREVEPVN